MYYLGIDHHKKFSQVAVMNKKGKLEINSKIANQKVAFATLKNHLNGNPCKATIEASRNWTKLYDLLEELGISTQVAHPLKLRAIGEAKIKTDTIDATTLAYLLRADLIPKIHVPPKEVREQKNLLRHRLWLVRLQTMTKNRIYDLLDRNHLELPAITNLFGQTGRKFLDNLKLSNIDTQNLCLKVLRGGCKYAERKGRSY